MIDVSKEKALQLLRVMYAIRAFESANAGDFPPTGRGRRVGRRAALVRRAGGRRRRRRRLPAQGRLPVQHPPRTRPRHRQGTRPEADGGGDAGQGDGLLGRSRRLDAPVRSRDRADGRKWDRRRRAAAGLGDRLLGPVSRHRSSDRLLLRRRCRQPRRRARVDQHGHRAQNFPSSTSARTTFMRPQAT